MGSNRIIAKVTNMGSIYLVIIFYFKDSGKVV